RRYDGPLEIWLGAGAPVGAPRSRSASSPPCAQGFAELGLLLLHDDSALGVREHAVALPVLACGKIIALALPNGADDLTRLPVACDHGRQILEEHCVLRSA